jgi:hypothetical protein
MNRMRGALLAATILVGVAATAASAMQFSSWSTAQKIDDVGGNHPDLNTPSLDGCPIQSPDGLSLYMAFRRCMSRDDAADARASREERHRWEWIAAAPTVVEDRGPLPGRSYKKSAPIRHLERQ